MGADGTYRDEVAAWPTEEPGAAELLRFYAAWGAGRASKSVALVGHPLGDEVGWLRWLVNCEQTQGAFDRVLLLLTLVEIDPARADEVARWIWIAADAGDSYGEWLWEWAEKQGIDPDRIVAEAQEELNDHPTMSGVRLIAHERRRQQTAEGWTPDHDAEHLPGDLTAAALAYLAVYLTAARPESPDAAAPVSEPPTRWPWDAASYKPAWDDPLKNLVRAGALIAAEIDRHLLGEENG